MSEPFSPAKRSEELNLVLLEWDDALKENEQIIQELKESMRRTDQLVLEPQSI